MLPLAGRLVGDVCAGTCASAITAPLVTCVDRAMTLNAAGQQELWPAFIEELVDIPTKPVAFFTSAPFLWIWLAYGITYVVANVCSTVSHALGRSPALPVLLATTSVNTLVCIAKDAKFAQMYGGDAASARPLPPSTYAAWLARDALTMGFVFSMPTIVARALPALPKLLCMFTTPLLAQYFTTPLYLLGLALYNLPTAPMRARLEAVSTAYPATVVTRQFRAVAQYSVSGVANVALRSVWR